VFIKFGDISGMQWIPHHVKRAANIIVYYVGARRLLRLTSMRPGSKFACSYSAHETRVHLGLKTLSRSRLKTKHSSLDSLAFLCPTGIQTNRLLRPHRVAKGMLLNRKADAVRVSRTKAMSIHKVHGSVRISFNRCSLSGWTGQKLRVRV
jgi:hypothetical protein